MRRVTLAILSIALSAGCALESGDPTASTGSTRPSEVTSTSGGEQLQAGRAPMIRAGTSPASASSATPPIPNPEPSPWTNPALDPNGDGSGENPEPAPWRLPNDGVQNGNGGGGNGNGSGTQSGGGSGKTTGEVPDHPSRIGHWDLKDTTSN